MNLWPAVILGAIVLLWSPVFAAVILRRDSMWIVVLLTCLTVFTGVTWFGAWLAVFMLPRKEPAVPPRRVWPYVPVQARWPDPGPDADAASMFLLGDRVGAGPPGR